MTLSDVREALTARNLVCLNLVSTNGGWQASARSEGGTGWLVALGESIEQAVTRLLSEASQAPEWKGKTRYWLGQSDARMLVTYNGQPPLESEGPVTEVDGATWAARRKIMDDVGDLL